MNGTLSTTAFYRNLAFGVQDAIVTTMGVMVASASVADVNVFRAGLVSVVASAFSMAIGAYQSERSAELATAKDDVDISRSELTGSAIVMFLSYALSGFLVVLPWRLLKNRRNAFVASVAISALLLTASAVFVSQNLQVEHIVWNAVEMLLLAFVAVVGSYFFSRMY